MDPPLPPFVLEPLSCPPAKCRYPGVPLPTESTFKLAVALEKCYSAVARHDVRLNMGSVVNQVALAGSVGENPLGEFGLVDMVIRDSFDEGNTPEQILLSSKGPDGRRRIGLILYATASDILPPAKSSSQFLRCAVLSLLNFHKFLHDSLPFESTHYCLHDLASDSTFDVPGILTTRAARLYGGSVDPLPDFDATNLVKRLTQGIKGDWKAQWAPWRSGKWEGKIAEAARGYARIVETMLLERMLGPEYMGASRFISNVCSPIKLASFLIGIAQNPPVSLGDSLARTEEGRQLLGLFSTPANKRSKILASIPPSALPPVPKYPAKSRELTPTERARFQLASPTAIETKRRPFDRFALLPNSSKYFSCVKTVANARFCPTDSCSRRQPIVGQYQKAQNLILIIFDNFLVSAALDYAAKHPALAISRHEFIRYLAKTAMSKAYSGSPVGLSDSWIDSEYLEFLMTNRELLDRLSSTGLISEVLYHAFSETWLLLIRMRTGPSDSSDRRFCLCDYTHYSDTLELMSEASTAALDAKLARRTVLEPLDMSKLLNEVEEMSERSDGRRCDGAKFLAPVDSRVTELFQRADSRVAFVKRWGSFFAVVDWGTLHEMMMFTTLSSKKDAGRLFGHLESVLGSAISLSLDSPTSRPTYSISECNIKSIADLRAAQEALVSATILDPTDYKARNNLATIRLRLIDDNSPDRHTQYSHVIYDCDAALYYGPPNFKSFFRRGTVLDRIGSSGLALADFKRALEIEPRNAVALSKVAEIQSRPIPQDLPPGVADGVILDVEIAEV